MENYKGIIVTSEEFCVIGNHIFGEMCGKVIRTSPLMELRNENGEVRAITRSGSVYTIVYK